MGRAVSAAFFGGWMASIYAGAAAVGTLPQPSGDWPQWGGADPGRNMVSAETNLPDTFNPGKPDAKGALAAGTGVNVRWRAHVGNHIYGNPTIAGGKVFVGTDGSGAASGRFASKPAGRVLCLDEGNGNLLWELDVPRSSSERLKKNFLSQEMSAGICASPAVDGSRVYVLTGNGLLLCLTVNGLAAGNEGPFVDEGRFMTGAATNAIVPLPTDADIVWIYDLVEELHIQIHDVSSGSPLVYGDYVYLETSNGVAEDHIKHPRPDAPSFIAIDKRTGRLVAVDDEKVGQRLFHCLWSPPSAGIVAGRQLVFFGGGDGVCYAFETPTGPPGSTAGPPQKLTKVWSYDCNPPEYKTRNGKPINYRAGDKRRGGKDGEAGNRGDGTYVGPSEIITGPMFYGGRVYVAIGQDPAHGRGRGMLHCIDAAKTGDISQSGRVWALDRIERTVSSVAIAGGRLYAADLGGHVYCLNPDTGELCWNCELHAETWSTPFVADGKVYIESVKGLHVLAAGTGRELAKVRLDAPANGCVVAAHGTLYVTSDKTIWAVSGAVPNTGHSPGDTK